MAEGQAEVLEAAPGADADAFAELDAAGQEARSYDVMGRVLTLRRTSNSITKDFVYAWNLNGSVKSITYPSGRRIDYTVNAAARPLSAVDTANSVNYATQATYCPCNANTSTKHGVTGSFAGITRSCTYNKRLQHITIAAASPTQTVFSLTYDYHLNVDNNGTVRQITNNLDGARTQSFTYDELNRTKTAEVPTAWGLSFGYNVWANLLTQTVTKGSAPMLNVSVNNQNKITNTGFSYDAAGNLINDGSLPYTYDAENRLTSADGFTYTYDGDGHRLQKSTGTLYWSGLSGQVLLETDSAGNNPKEYIFFIGKRIARRNPDGTVYYFFEDDLFSIHVVTNATGTVVEDSDYYPFGGERVFTDTLDNNYKFTGHERDTETGLDYYQYRMLSSSLGRWTSTDPVMASAFDPQSLNRYNYVVNNPPNLTDALGLLPADPCEPIGIISCVLGDVFCPGTTDCSYYDDRCGDPRVTQKWYYCGVAPPVCREAGDFRLANCVCLCLQQKDNCWRIRKEARFISCIAELHYDCIAGCLSNPFCYLPTCDEQTG